MSTRTYHGTSINSRLVLNPPDSPPPTYHPGDVIVNTSNGQQLFLERMPETCRNCRSTEIFLDDDQGDRICHQCGHVAEGHIMIMNHRSTSERNHHSLRQSQGEELSSIEIDDQRVPLSCNAKPINKYCRDGPSSKLAATAGKRSRVRKIPRLRKRRRLLPAKETTVEVVQHPALTTSANTNHRNDHESQMPLSVVSQCNTFVGLHQQTPEQSQPTRIYPPPMERTPIPQKSTPEPTQRQDDIERKHLPLHRDKPSHDDTPSRKDITSVTRKDPRPDVGWKFSIPHFGHQSLPPLRQLCRAIAAILLVMLWLERCKLVSAVNPLPDTVTDTQYVISLTDWQLSSHDQSYANLSAPGVVPGDVLTILLNNRIIQDPYHDRNFVTQRHIWMGGDQDPVDGNFTERQWTTTWIYSTTFETPAPSNDTALLYWKVILEGVKMGADVAVNGIKIGEATDQFLRYDIDLDQRVLRQGVLQGDSLRHTLTISFDPSKKVDGRFTACSGGWDWAPYAREQDAQGTQMFTLGVVKPVSVIGVKHFYISYVVPKIYYLGDHPTSPMQRAEADFRLEVEIHLNFVAPTAYRFISDLVLRTPFGNKTARVAPVNRRQHSTVVTMSLIVPKEKVELWWPNGMGGHQLYDISVGIDDRSATECIHKRVGFRVSALVTTNDTAVNETSYATLQEGSGQHGMYFRINGAVVVARGANFIPTDQLEGRQSDHAHRIIVQSAARANMNMIRIWGGGMVPPDAFYDTCDEEGVLLYHDLMFVDEAGHRPVKTLTVKNEIRHLVRSLASHPSIVVWSGCNECDVVMGTPSEIYATFAMKTVAEEDDSRSIWPSSPSRHGWRSGVNQLNSRPLGGKSHDLTTWDPRSFSSVAESHGPYMRSFSRSYRGMNGNDAHFPYINTPPILKEVDVGVSFPNQFSSEFGSSVMSSFESMSGTLSQQFWSLHGGSGPDNCTHKYGNDNNCMGVNVMAERNYPCDTHIFAYFGVEEDALNDTGKYAFQKQLYMCLMAQTLWMKGEIESRRSKNMFGMLIWQLNENFPTGGWGCIEYGKDTKDGSQILGGRWKPLMHLLELSLFRDQIVACGQEGLCYVRNDGMSAVSAIATFEAWNLHRRNGLENVNKFLYNTTLNSGEIQWFRLPNDFVIGDNQVFLVNLDTDLPGTSTQVSSESVFLQTMPKNITGLGGSVSIKILSIQGVEKGRALVSLESDRLALFVVLTTRAKGRFAENCFSLRPLQKKTVEFRPFIEGESVDLNLLKSSIRVEHLGLYISDSIAEDAKIQ
ncbi:glycoside hydrolase family 2 sugar binding protein [Nitzschia inconspicua]|uniref:Glycoside hydrolase family 2 sugar binding protein n=1 Tax=Nitzschia inconspicua TaxID=303405 RepID=A0A9K3LM63_9STRA|nr:glycoside hydrolase family 2 sugar binding protein [Nitzschia inconspicua]